MPPKESRASDDSSKRKRSPTPPTSSDQLAKILRFLLDEAVTEFGNGASAKQPNLFDHIPYSAEYTPFQNLVASVVMSKPISSRLGVRTLLTIFQGDDGIDLSTPEKLRDAGEDGRYDALSKARTQHKDKTSLQLGKLADRVLELYSESEGDVSLKKMREELGGDPGNLPNVLKEFYGVGDTATEIFRRRMQGDWEELYPFADERTMNAAAHLGLAHESAEKLADQIKSVFPAEDGRQERQQYTRIVDALVACDLEHRYDDVLELVGPGDGEEEEAEKGDSEPPKKSAKKD